MWAVMEVIGVGRGEGGRVGFPTLSTLINIASVTGSQVFGAYIYIFLYITVSLLFCLCNVYFGIFYSVSVKKPVNL